MILKRTGVVAQIGVYVEGVAKMRSIKIPKTDFTEVLHFIAMGELILFFIFVDVVR